MDVKQDEEIMEVRNFLAPRNLLGKPFGTKVKFYEESLYEHVSKGMREIRIRYKLSLRSI